MQRAHAHRVYQRTAHEDRNREAPKGWAEDQAKLLMGKMKCASHGVRDITPDSKHHGGGHE
jgi:hypothetical protein